MAPSQITPIQTANRRARRIAAVSALTVAAQPDPAASGSAHRVVLQNVIVSSVAAGPTPTTGARSTLELSAQTDTVGRLVALLVPALRNVREPALALEQKLTAADGAAGDDRGVL